MNKETLKELINQKFDDKVIITDFREKNDRLPLLNNDGYSWRDYLLQTSEFRLEYGKRKHFDSDILKETQLFIEELRKLPEDAILIIWRANSKTNRYVGWASEDKLIYAHKIKRTSNE
jgi:hypothetical protein